MQPGEHRVERNHQHDAGEHLCHQQKVHERFASLKTEPRHAVGGKAGKSHTDDHGTHTGDKAVDGHPAEIVDAEELFKGIQ